MNITINVDSTVTLTVDKAELASLILTGQVFGRLTVTNQWWGDN
jgi:hypothetical protein